MVASKIMIASGLIAAGVTGVSAQIAQAPAPAVDNQRIDETVARAPQGAPARGLRMGDPNDVRIHYGMNNSTGSTIPWFPHGEIDLLNVNGTNKTKEAERMNMKTYSNETDGHAKKNFTKVYVQHTQESKGRDVYLDETTVGEPYENRHSIADSDADDDDAWVPEFMKREYDLNLSEIESQVEKREKHLRKMRSFSDEDEENDIDRNIELTPEEDGLVPDQEVETAPGPQFPNETEPQLHSERENHSQKVTSIVSDYSNYPDVETIVTNATSTFTNTTIPAPTVEGTCGAAGAGACSESEQGFEFDFEHGISFGAGAFHYRDMIVQYNTIMYLVVGLFVNLFLACALVSSWRAAAAPGGMSAGESDIEFKECENMKDNDVNAMDKNMEDERREIDG